VTSVDKALQVLLSLANASEPLGVREISRRVGISPPTVHRLLATLVSYDLAQQVGDRSVYRLGWACLDLGRAVLGGTEVAQVAPTIAYSLRDATKETVTAQIRDGNDQVVVFEAEGVHELRRRVGIGRRIPLHVGASGRAILAFMPPGEVERYLGGRLTKVTPNTVTDPDELRDRLDRARALGYATSHEETVAGIAGASVPVFDQDGVVVGSLSVSGPDARIGEALEARVVPLLIEAGQTLSRGLGYRARGLTA
jgi:DNA-binding IclR family transcriptional regulator